LLYQIQNLLEYEMRIVITGGPGSEPIDRVRFITNQSTGELAVKLARRFLDGGHQVELFLGDGAVWRLETATYFQTTADLERLLNEIVQRDRVDAVLHAAALSDFGIGEKIVSGRRTDASKIPSDAESVLLRLVPRPKLIRHLRELFPNAYIVGWKFELEGTPADVVKEGVRQIQSNRTDACVVNGSAFGPGFGFCISQGLLRTVPSKDALADWLLDRLSKETAQHGGG
jgi:phosphopantothenoylcysteine synthetase/decarboxylase